MEVNTAFTFFLLQNKNNSKKTKQKKIKKP